MRGNKQIILDEINEKMIISYEMYAFNEMYRTIKIINNRFVLFLMLS